MSIILNKVIEYRSELCTRIKQLEAVAPVHGSMSVLRKNGRPFYMIRGMDNSKKAIYVPLEKTGLISRYSRARLKKAVLPVLRANLKAADAFIASHSGIEEDDAARKLDPAILENCADLYAAPETIALEWKSSLGPERVSAGPEPSIVTASGVLVRSKSEALIANALTAAGQTFIYEKALYLGSKNYAFFPDFTILRLSDMKEIYWEHFGMMDDLHYMEDALKKISAYIENGIIPGVDLICTFECLHVPLSSKDVEDYIKAILL